MLTIAMVLAATATPMPARSRSVVTPILDHCRQDPRLVGRTGAPLRARPLDREPNAAKLAAVWRRDSRGCPQPILLQKDIGNTTNRPLKN